MSAAKRAFIRSSPPCFAKRFGDFECLYLIGQHILNPMPDLLKGINLKLAVHTLSNPKNLTIFSSASELNLNFMPKS